MPATGLPEPKVVTPTLRYSSFCLCRVARHQPHMQDCVSDTLIAKCRSLNSECLSRGWIAWDMAQLPELTA